MMKPLGDIDAVENPENEERDVLHSKSFHQKTEEIIGNAPQTVGIDQRRQEYSINRNKEVKEGVFQKTDTVLGSKKWFDFSLPGQGARAHYCGEFYTVGCLEHGYIEKRMKSCFRADCPVCRQKWAGRLAGKAEWRISQVDWLGPPKHITISLPDSEYGLVQADYPKLRAKIYRITKRTGVRGGCLVFHPARRRCLKCGLTPEMGHCICVHCGNPWFAWYFSPHFHIVGFGWIEGTAEEFKKTGYVVKNIGERRSVGGTVLYILSHAGVHEKYHVLTWFGDLSYNKLKVDAEERRGNECPTCGAKMMPCRWTGKGPSPLESEPEGEYWMDTEGWEYTARYKHGEWGERGEYRRGHYEAIRGISHVKPIQFNETSIVDYL